MPPVWVMMPGVEPDALGLLPELLDEDCPLSAREQFNLSYAHGGGWCPMDGAKLGGLRLELRFPHDPPCQLMAFTKLRTEMVALFEHELVAIIQPDGSFEVARMD